MSDDAKIAWYTIGSFACGFWVITISGALIHTFMSLATEGLQPDAVGLIITVVLVILMVGMPAFAGWKFFKKVRVMSAERKKNFEQKDAFR